jgi:L-Ala-D/L-Glu epimerase
VIKEGCTVKIRDVVVWVEAIPLRFSFKHALAERRQSGSIIFRVTLDNGVCGWGEALPRDYITGETVERCLCALRDRIAPRLAGVELSTAATLQAVVFAFLDDPATGRDLAAICALELALIDALGNSMKQTAYAFLGCERKTDTVVYSMVLGSGAKTSGKLVFLSRLAGIDHIKVKVANSFEDNERHLRLVKKGHPRASLRIDVNCAWTLDEAVRNLDMMRHYRIVSCEQPLAKDDIAGHARLVAAYPDILICADESLCSYGDAETLVRERAASCFNIRISKNGGLLYALRIHALATEAGIPCQLGAQVGETAIISAAGRLFVGMAGDLRFHEGSFGTWLIRGDVTGASAAFGLGGRATTLCRGWGLGVLPVESRVDRYAQQHVVIPVASSVGATPRPRPDSAPMRPFEAVGESA